MTFVPVNFHLVIFETFKNTPVFGIAPLFPEEYHPPKFYPRRLLKHWNFPDELSNLRCGTEAGVFVCSRFLITKCGEESAGSALV